MNYRVIYRADGEPLQAWRCKDNVHPYFTLLGPADDVAARYPSVCSTYDRAKGKGAAWVAPIHMPRWASRLTLTVTDVRIQRLQDISEEDARAEGVSPWQSGRFHCGYDDDGEVTAKSPITAYAWLWDRINGSGSWAANPWVAAYSFTTRFGNIDEVIPA